MISKKVYKIYLFHNTKLLPVHSQMSNSLYIPSAGAKLFSFSLWQFPLCIEGCVITKICGGFTEYESRTKIKKHEVLTINSGKI